MTRLLNGAALLAMLTLLACDGTEPDVPRPGELVVQLTSPNVDGALVLTIIAPSAGQVGAITAASPDLTVFRRTIGGTVRVAVFGELRGGPVVRVAVPDVRALTSYAAQVTEAAGADNALRPSLDGYAAFFRAGANAP